MRAPKIDRLYVLWSPRSGRRHVIGHLSRTAEGYAFWYEDELSGARAQGFDLLPMFPEYRTADAPYRARYLWSTFADRIPSPKRPDAGEILERWGVPGSDDQFEILARSGGLRATDRLELAEYRGPGDTLTTPLEFRVAGGRYLSRSTVDVVRPGDRLGLVRDAENEYDPSATYVVTAAGTRVGWVPRQYSELIARHLRLPSVLEVVAVRELVVPDDEPRWVIRVMRRPAT